MATNKIIGLAKKPIIRKLIHIYRRVLFNQSVEIPQIKQVEVFKSGHDYKRLNLIVPSINEEHYFGGTDTAINFFKTLLEQCGSNYRSRIIVTDAKPTKNALNNLDSYVFCPGVEESNVLRQVVYMKSENIGKLAVSCNDTFIATAWWTAYLALNIIEKQMTIFKSNGHKLFYLIQDYEPCFYNWSSHFVLADSTYRSDIKTIAIFNSSLLQKFFKANKYQFYKEYSFEPVLNPALKACLPTTKEGDRKKKIIFYGRPTVDRNCFPLIIEGIREWARSDNRHADWQIVSVGEKHPPIHLDKKQKIESLGKLNLSEYANLLKESAIGISFMVSPHPSYPPLEMAHFGLMTLTNCHTTKDLSDYHDNIFSLWRLTPEKISEALKRIIDKFDSNPLIGIEGKSKIPGYTNKSDQFNFVKDLVNHLA